MAKVEVTRDQRKEAIGWLSIAAIMVLFPVLFFVCVWIPIWLGVAGY